MKRFDDGVQFYTTGRMQMDIPFPEDETVCYYCRFCNRDRLDRPYCMATSEILTNINATRGQSCPIIIGGIDDGKNV